MLAYALNPRALINPTGGLWTDAFTVTSSTSPWRTENAFTTDVSSVYIAGRVTLTSSDDRSSAPSVPASKISKAVHSPLNS